MRSIHVVTPVCLVLLLTAIGRSETLHPKLPPDGPEEPVLSDERQVFPTGDESWRFDRTTYWPMIRLSPHGRKLLYLRHDGGAGEQAVYALMLRDLKTGEDTRVPVPPVARDWANIYPRIGPFGPSGDRMVLSLFKERGGRPQSTIVLWRVGEDTPVETGLEGRFAFAKFDRTGKQLVVSRDRKLVTAAIPEFRVKPLGVPAVNWTACPTKDLVALYRPEVDPDASRRPTGKLVLYDITAKKELSVLPLQDGSALDDLETPWTRNGRYVYYRDKEGVRVWDREAGKLAATIGRQEFGRCYPFGPGPTTTTMLIKRLPDGSQERSHASETILLHDAGSGDTWKLGGPGTELQDARASRAVYLRHHADGSATVHVADVAMPTPEK